MSGLKIASEWLLSTHDELHEKVLLFKIKVLPKMHCSPLPAVLY
jgi:hypothetical protein